MSKNLAEHIADALFTNGNGDKAKCLVLKLEDGRDGGGWSYRGAVGHIAKAAHEWLFGKAPHESAGKDSP